MSSKIECPNCLGTGEEYSSRRKGSNNCFLCEGNKEIDIILAEDYISSLNTNYNDDIAYPEW